MILGLRKVCVSHRYHLLLYLIYIYISHTYHTYVISIQAQNAARKIQRHVRWREKLAQTGFVNADKQTHVNLERLGHIAIQFVVSADAQKNQNRVRIHQEAYFVIPKLILVVVPKQRQLATAMNFAFVVLAQVMSYPFCNS